MKVVSYVLPRFSNTISDTTVESLKEFILKNDIYNFLSKTVTQNGDSCQMSFSHYLIQKAVVASLMPQKKTKIHQILVQHYESCLISDQKNISMSLSNYLQPIISHIMELSNENDRKLKYLLLALEGAAETGRFVEGMYFSEILEGLFTQETISPYFMATYHRHMIKIYYLNL